MIRTHGNCQDLSACSKKMKTPMKIIKFKRTQRNCQDLSACSKKMKIPSMRETPKATSRGCEMLPRWMSRKPRERFCNQKVKAKSVIGR